MSEQESNRSSSEYDSLDRLSVMLYVNKSSESWEAFQVLEEAKIPFGVAPSPTNSLFVDWDDLVLDGLVGVQDLAAVQQFMKEAVWREAHRTMPFLISDPEVKRFQEDLRIRQLEEARTALSKIQKESSL